jgi:predicted nucleic acid-binding protein
VEARLILVDTNAWIHHLRKHDPRLSQYLLEQRVHTCDVVVGELLLGSGLPKTLATDLLLLPRVPSPSASETRLFIERHLRSFSTSGVGWADAQIILAAAKAGARLYTSDRAVRRVSKALRVALA